MRNKERMQRVWDYQMKLIRIKNSTSPFCTILFLFVNYVPTCFGLYS